MTPAQCANEINRRADALVRGSMQTARVLVREMKDSAEANTRGPYSLARLAEMGHPYAKRRPRPPMHPGILNKQTGRLNRSFRMGMPTVSSGTIHARIYNVDPKAERVETGLYSRAIARPLPVVVKADMMRNVVGAARSTVKRSLKV